MTSKLPIDQQISWLSSHAAGVMKAHPLTPPQEDFWQTILNVTQEAARSRRQAETAKPAADAAGGPFYDRAELQQRRADQERRQGLPPT